jgi:signal transduction histidine kinase
VQTKFVDKTFEYNELNLIVCFDDVGQMVYSKAYELPESTENALLMELNRFFKENDVLGQLSSFRDKKRGVVSISESLFIVASRPIVTSSGEGPVKGAIVMCREVTVDRIAVLQRKLNLDIDIVASSGMDIPSEFQETKDNVQIISYSYVEPVNSSVVSGYVLLIDVFGDPCGILSVDIPRSIYQQGVSTTNTYTIVTIIWCICFACVSLLVLEKALLSRVLNLTKAVMKITQEEDITKRIPLSNKKSRKKDDDEISLLAKSINHMLEKIQEITANLNTAQRFAAIGELSVMIAHDLRNPLQGITIATNYLRRKKNASVEKTNRMLDIIDADVEYCEKIVSDLLGYSKEIKIAPSKTNVKTLLAMALSHIKIPENVRVHDLTKDDAEFFVDKNKMVRVFDNLIKNAIEAMPNGGSLTITTKVSDKKMRISFVDTGKGIQKDNMEKMFTPLFTTKAKGMGFGLAIVKRIVEAHNGKIAVESLHNKGTGFTLELPK